MSARSLAEEFFAHMEAGEVDEILGMMTPEATVSLVPLNRHGPMAADGASYLRELARSFPDLLVRVRRLFVTGDNTAVAEITIDGTQADALGKVRTVGKVIWTTLIDAFPDLTNAMTSLRADGDGNVAAEVGTGGTQVRPFGAIACAGGHYELPHLFLFHVTGEGLIDDIVGYWDNVGWKKQLGCLEVD